MITFIVLAAVLTIGGALLIAVPLLKKAPGGDSPAPWAAAVSVAVLFVGSAVLYVIWSSWSWQHKVADDSPQTMVARLARKLEKNPADLPGWLMLGRSYTALQQYSLAQRAFARADRLAGGKNAEALIGEAEALALADETELDRRAGRLIEQALALDPDSGKALFFGAAAAMRRGELPLARDRFARLLAMDPPANIKPLLQRQIAVIDRRLAGLPDESGAPPPVAGDQTQHPAPAAAGSGSEPADPRAAVRINVTLSAALASAAPRTAPCLYLCVIRLVRVRLWRSSDWKATSRRRWS